MSEPKALIYRHLATDSPFLVKERLYGSDCILFGIYFPLCNGYSLTGFAEGSLSTRQVENRLFTPFCDPYAALKTIFLEILHAKWNELINLKNVLY